MENKMIMVTSASNNTLVVNVPELKLKKAWRKKGASYPIDKDVLFQAYYNPGVESLFRDGKLYTNDKEFLLAVGLIEDEKEEPIILTDAYLTRLIKTMPVVEVKKEMAKLNRAQIEEVIDYAINNYISLSMDRVDYFKQISGKDILKSIEYLKMGQEA